MMKKMDRWFPTFSRLARYIREDPKQALFEVFLSSLLGIALLVMLPLTLLVGPPASEIDKKAQRDLYHHVTVVWPNARRRR